MLAGLRFDRERLAAAAGDEMVAATDVADLLVRKGMPFREAHGVVGGLVRDGARLAAGRSRSSSREELAEHSELLDEEYYEVLAEGAWLESKVSAGGTSSPAPGGAARGRSHGARRARAGASIEQRSAPASSTARCTRSRAS